MSTRVQLVAVVAALVLFFVVFELVRSRRMMERYALLWLVCSLVLAGLAIWTDLLTDFANTIGIKTPSNALFLVAFGFVLLLLLHFSVVISSLSDRSVVLAQRVGMLQQELDAYKGEPTIDEKIARQVAALGSPDEAPRHGERDS